MSKTPLFARRFSDWRLVALMGIVVLAVLLRIIGLDAKPIQNDEAFSWRLTTYPCTDLVRRSGMDVNPPGYYLALKGWLSFVTASPSGLRGLSVVFGVLCVPVIYMCCLDASKDADEPLNNSPNSTIRFGALLSAFLMAAHVFQVAYSQNARMYSMGVFLAGLTSWTLIRALRGKQQAGWWCAYIVSAAMFCYTHTYASFTVAAQFCFAVGDLLVRSRKDGLRSVTPQLFACGISFGFVIALYSPWVPVLLFKTDDVTSDEFFPKLSAAYLQFTLLTWSVGFSEKIFPAILWLLALLIGLTKAIQSGSIGKRASVFFGLQLIAPWIAGLLITAITSSNLFQQRYMAFAHFSLLALWGTVIGHSSPKHFTICLTLIAISPCLGGLFTKAAGTGPSALVPAVEKIRSVYEPEDLILVNFPEDVNILRYYLAAAGLTDLNVRCIIDPFESHGHIHHIAALDANDIVWGVQEPSGKLLQLWRSRSGEPAALNLLGLQAGERWRFEGAEVDTYFLTVYSKSR